MSVHIVPTTETYRVHDDSKVTLRITIGEAQGGAWVVAWNADDVVARGSNPDNIELGVGRALSGRVLQVVVVAIGIRPETNRLSRQLAIDGGADGVRQVVDRWDQGASGDTAVFTTMIGFQ